MVGRGGSSACRDCPSIARQTQAVSSDQFSPCENVAAICGRMSVGIPSVYLVGSLASRPPTRCLHARVSAPIARLLGRGLSRVARRTEALPVCDVVPQVWPRHDCDDVVSVGLAAFRTHTPARPALPVITLEHSQPPRLVLRRAVATLMSIWAIVSSRQLVVCPGRANYLDSLRHLYAPKSCGGRNASSRSS